MKANNSIHADDGFDSKLVLGADFEGVLDLPIIKPPKEIIIPDSYIPFSEAEKAQAQQLLSWSTNSRKTSVDS